MSGLGKGIGVGLCGLAIGFATWATKDPRCCAAFIAVMFMAWGWDEKK